MVQLILYANFMLNKFLNSITSITPIDSSILEDIESKFEIVSVPKKTHVVKEGEVCNYMYVIIQGIVRMYYVKDSDEICSLLIEENYPFSVPDSFYTGRPSYQFVETLEDSRIARIHIDELRALYNQYFEANYIARIITEKYFLRSEERLFMLRKQAAEERYRYFIERYPSLLLRVPLTHIASYLGMTIETLSRCRNKFNKG
jgi:hypothetical protein